VSRSWLHTQPDLLVQIRQEQPRPATATTVPTRQAAGDGSLRQRLQLAHQRIQELEADNHHANPQAKAPPGTAAQDNDRVPELSAAQVHQEPRPHRQRRGRVKLLWLAIRTIEDNEPASAPRKPVYPRAPRTALGERAGVPPERGRRRGGWSAVSCHP
jgi:hypothetical protein